MTRKYLGDGQAKVLDAAKDQGPVDLPVSAVGAVAAAAETRWREGADHHQGRAVSANERLSTSSARGRTTTPGWNPAAAGTDV
jgi:hypothetical protein